MIDQSSAARQRVCPKCQKINRAGVVFCEDCGTPITTGARKAERSTQAVPHEIVDRVRGLVKGQEDTTSDSQGEIRVHIRPGTPVFKSSYRLRFVMSGGDRPLEITPLEGMMIVFGRNDPDDHYEPEVDLLPYDGYKHGISRRHAAVKVHRERVDLIDLKSSNGTFVNGERIRAGAPVQLRDGDEVKMGSLVMRVNFTM